MLMITWLQSLSFCGGSASTSTEKDNLIVSTTADQCDVTKRYGALLCYLLRAYIMIINIDL